jgi:ribose transport system substrate-binding protein
MAIAGVMIVGCGSGSGSDSSSTGAAASGTTSTATGGSAASGKKYTIAVIPKGSTHEYWKSVHAGANDAAAELGATIEFQGPLKENDEENQISVVEDVLVRGADAIVLAPLDAKGLEKPVGEAAAKKVPVIIIDSALADTAGTASFVATDNEKGGQMAADELIKELGGKGKVVVLKYAVGSASTEDREKGFEEEIKSKAPGITIVSDNQMGGPTIDTAQTASERLLGPLKGPDGKLTIQGVFASNESNAVGMLNVLKENKWNGTVKFVGFDSNSRLIEGLASGDINALVIQNPYKIGYEGVKAAIAAIKGEKVETRIDTGAALITKANMDTPENQKLLKPKQA